MPTRKSSKHRDIWIAAAVLAASTVVTAAAYDRVFASEISSRFDLGAVPDGRESFLVYQQERCVGSIRSLHERQELNRLGGELELFTDQNGQESPLHLEVEGFFNPLGQLVRSHGDFRYGSMRLSVTQVDVHPMQLQISATVAGVQTNRDLSLPGPVVLEQHGRSAALRYPPLGALFSRHENLSGSAIRSAGLQIRKVHGEPPKLPACPPNERGLLDLRGLTLPQLPFFPQIQGLIGRKEAT